MGISLVVVDAFSNVAFHGNPAAIALVGEFPSDRVMQDIALEMNLSETAFVAPRSDGDYDLRWFTPSVEIDLCGHATLASAHVIGTDVRFHTKSGVLSCTKGDDGWISMDFPADPPRAADPPEWFSLEDLTWFGAGRFGKLIELARPELVREFVPDFAELARLSDHAVVITARCSDGEADFVSRVFGPSIGVSEDPVTGAAHCMLAVYWGERLELDHLTGEQASPRGGIVKVARRGNRVELRGQAITVSTVKFLDHEPS